MDTNNHVVYSTASENYGTEELVCSDTGMIKLFSTLPKVGEESGRLVDLSTKAGAVIKRLEWSNQKVTVNIMSYENQEIKVKMNQPYHTVRVNGAEALVKIDDQGEKYVGLKLQEYEVAILEFSLTSPIG